MGSRRRLLRHRLGRRLFDRLGLGRRLLGWRSFRRGLLGSRRRLCRRLPGYRRSRSGRWRRRRCSGWGWGWGWRRSWRRINRLGRRFVYRLVTATEQPREEARLAVLGRHRCRCGPGRHRRQLGRVERLAIGHVHHLARRALAAAQSAFQGAGVQRIGVFAGKRHALHRTLPQAPELADLPRPVGEVRTARAGIGAVATHFIAGERATRLRVERMQANQHLVDHLLVAERLQQARVVTGQVDHHVGATLERRFDPQHAQAGVAVDFARHARTAFPDRGLELEQQLVAPAVVGALERRQVLVVQARGHLDLGQGAQRYRQHHVVGAVAHRADLDRDAVLVLDDRADRCAGLDGLQLLDESLRQHRAAAGQTGGAQVAIAHIAVHAGLLREIQQRQARRLVIAGTDLLVDQLARGRWQLQLVQPAGNVELVEGEQGAVGRRVFRVADRARQVVEGLLVALECLGGGRLLGGQVCGAEVLAIDQVARYAHELRRRQGGQLEGVEVAVEGRLGLAVADPLAGGQARTPAHARLGFQQGHLPALVLQFVGGGEACQAATDHDGRRLLGSREGARAEQPYHYQRAGAQPTSRHSANSGSKAENAG